MRAQVITCSDPLRPSNHRTVALVRRGRSLRNLAPRVSQPVICQLNGQWISRKAWNRRLRDGDVAVFVALPQNGGGGGSNPMRIILTIVVMVASYYTGGAVGAAYGAGWGAVAGAAVSIVGMALVNALVPLPKPTQAELTASLSAASPTYNLGAQGNTARLGQPIPAVFGRMKVYPDFAAMPYLEYAGNEQYLYQLFCIGQGEYEVEGLFIEDTPISSFEEISYEIVQPWDAVTLFPTRVITSVEVSGQEALTATVLGPFVANPGGTLANYLAVDVVFSRGLYLANDSGGLSGMTVTWTVEAQEINDDGVALGAWFALGHESYSAATTTPQRFSYKYAVPEGRYQVRFTRTDTKSGASAAGHEIDWAGLRAYLPGSQIYGDVTMLAMRARATNNLSQQASRKVNLIVTRKLNTWSPETGWSTEKVPTRSIAWAMAEIARAQYGGRLPDSRIALQSLHALDATWSARGDTFNGVFDSQGTVMEALSLAARAGRAIAFQQGGVVQVVRDQPSTLPAAMFTQRNIVRGSMKLRYMMPTDETADSLELTYWDETTWSERTVMCALPGSLKQNTAKGKIFGVTSRAQAWREGMYTVACNRYRRRLPTWETEMEGYIPTLLDKIALQHDMPRWGQSGEIAAWHAATKTATLTEPLDWSAGGAHAFGFRRRNGTMSGPYVALAGADAHHVVLSDWNAATDPTPDTGDGRERAHFAFGPSNAYMVECSLASVRPRTVETVELSAVVDSPYVHTADTGVPPDDSAWQLPSKFTVPVVLGLTARSMPTSPDKMVMSWQPAAGAEYYLVEQSAGDGNWTRTGEPSTNNFTATALYGPATIVRVCGVGVARGPWVEVAYGQLASYFWSGNDSNAFWTSDSALMWRY